MTARLNTTNLVRALRQTLDKASRAYEDRLRTMPLGDAPIFILGDGPAYLAAQTAALSFASLAGRPCLVRSLGEFRAYDLPFLRPRIPVLTIRLTPDSESAIELLRAAKRRGAWLMDITTAAGNSLAVTADQVLVLPEEAEFPTAAPGVVCAHAAAGALGLSAVLIFKPQNSERERQLSQFRDLPEYLDRLFSQSSNALRPMMDEVKQVRRLLILGCGFSKPAAAQAAVWMETALGCYTYGGNPAEFPASIPNGCNEGTGVIFLSGSSSPHKKLIHVLAEQIAARHCSILAVTDAGDAELIRLARISLLLPPVPEMTGAVLQLAVMQWMASWAEPEPRPLTAALSKV